MRYSVAGDIQNQCFRSVTGHDVFQKVRHYSNIGYFEVESMRQLKVLIETNVDHDQ